MTMAQYCPLFSVVLAGIALMWSSGTLRRGTRWSRFLAATWCALLLIQAAVLALASAKVAELQERPWVGPGLVATFYEPLLRSARWPLLLGLGTYWLVCLAPAARRWLHPVGAVRGVVRATAVVLVWLGFAEIGAMTVSGYLPTMVAMVSAKRTWSSAGLEDYRYWTHRAHHGPGVEDVVVDVRDGQAESIRAATRDARRSYETYQRFGGEEAYYQEMFGSLSTIERLYRGIIRNWGSMFVHAEFDDDLGYPAEIRIVRGLGFHTDTTIRVWDLHPLDAPLVPADIDLPLSGEHEWLAQQVGRYGDLSVPTSTSSAGPRVSLVVAIDHDSIDVDGREAIRLVRGDVRDSDRRGSIITPLYDRAQETYDDYGFHTCFGTPERETLSPSRFLLLADRDVGAALLFEVLYTVSHVSRGMSPQFAVRQRDAGRLAVIDEISLEF